jgi:hypothetical protein
LKASFSDGKLQDIRKAIGARSSTLEGNRLLRIDRSSNQVLLGRQDVDVVHIAEHGRFDKVGYNAEMVSRQNQARSRAAFLISLVLTEYIDASLPTIW